MATADREKALEAALAQIDKQYGKGSVMRLGDEVRAPIEVIPTGSIALDVALGSNIGGRNQEKANCESCAQEYLFRTKEPAGDVVG